MSMCTCEECGRFINSDDDPECFVEIGNMRRLHKTIILCESCRNERWEELERQEGMAASVEEMTGDSQ